MLCHNEGFIGLYSPCFVYSVHQSLSSTSGRCEVWDYRCLERCKITCYEIFISYVSVLFCIFVCVFFFCVFMDLVVWSKNEWM